MLIRFMLYMAGQRMILRKAIINSTTLLVCGCKLTTIYYYAYLLASYYACLLSSACCVLHCLLLGWRPPAALGGWCGFFFPFASFFACTPIFHHSHSSFYALSFLNTMTKVVSEIRMEIALRFPGRREFYHHLMLFSGIPLIL